MMCIKRLGLWTNNPADQQCFMKSGLDWFRGKSLRYLELLKFCFGQILSKSHSCNTFQQLKRRNYWNILFKSKGIQFHSKVKSGRRHVGIQFSTLIEKLPSISRGGKSRGSQQELVAVMLWGIPKHLHKFSGGNQSTSTSSIPSLL